MNSSIIAASIASLFLLSLTTSASAQMGGGKTSPSMSSSTATTASKTCKVKSVATSSFDCGSQTYDVTSSTTYTGTTFSELAAGMTVTVGYHMSGTSAVADSVAAK